MMFAEFYTITRQRDALVAADMLSVDPKSATKQAKQHGRDNGFMAFRLMKGQDKFRAEPITKPQRLAPSHLPILGP